MSDDSLDEILTARPIDDFFESSCNTAPEKRLWMSVVIMFLYDVQKDYWKYRESTNGKSQKLYDKLMNHLVLLDDEWMELVCEYADVDLVQLETTIKLIISGKKEIKIPRMN